MLETFLPLYTPFTLSPSLGMVSNQQKTLVATPAHFNEVKLGLLKFVLLFQTKMALTEEAT